MIYLLSYVTVSFIHILPHFKFTPSLSPWGRSKDVWRKKSGIYYCETIQIWKKWERRWKTEQGNLLRVIQKMVINSKPLLCNFIVLNLSKFCNSYKGSDRSELILDISVSIIPWTIYWNFRWGYLIVTKALWLG